MLQLKKGFILETDFAHAQLVQDYSRSESSKRRLKDGERESDSGEEEDGEYTPGTGNTRARESCCEEGSDEAGRFQARSLDDIQAYGQAP